MEIHLHQRVARFSGSGARLLIIRKGSLMLIFFRTASPNEKRLAPPRIISILGLCVGVTVQALGQSSPPATVPVGTAGVQSSAVSEQSVEAAAEEGAQKPVAAAISVRFQNYTYYGVGRFRRRENAFLVEPGLPFKVSRNW